ncbi:MAG: RNA polymerase sigma factor [Bacteroidota bacterium]|jgi:RNA polymerase sigma factor (sigma-70 family)
MSYNQIIQGCQRLDRNSQRQMFEQFYSLLMGVSLRYSKNSAQAKELLSKGFAELCGSINEIKKDHDLEAWLKRKMICFSVNFLRSKRQEYFITSTVHLVDQEKKASFDLFHQQYDPDYNSLSPSQYLEAIQLLPPSFRSVYNLMVVDQFTVQEVSELLEISEETCKYNLGKAKEVLFKNIQHLQKAA